MLGKSRNGIRCMKSNALNHWTRKDFNGRLVYNIYIITQNILGEDKAPPLHPRKDANLNYMFTHLNERMSVSHKNM